MHIYFTASQIPELRGLPQAVRSIVVKRTLGVLRSHSRLFYWLPVLFCVIGCVGGMYGLTPFFHLPAAVGNNLVDKGLFGLAVGLSTGFVTGFIGSQLQLWKLRPLLCGVINDYISEIHAA